MTRTKVLGYVRVSSERQCEDGVSLDAQRERLAAYATALNLELVHIYEDAGVSAKSLKRPGLQAALAALTAGQASGVLICKLDRLTRNVADLGRLISDYFGTRFDLLSVADSIDTRTAAGRLVLNVLTSVGQWEREATGERTADALRFLKGQGVRLGAEGIGWRRSEETDADGRRVVVEAGDELATVRRIKELRATGISLRQICTALAVEGHATKKGGRWSPKVVRSVLLRAA